MKLGSFKNSVNMDSLVFVNWNDRKALKLNIQECNIIMKSANNEGLEERPFLLPILKELKAYSDTNGNVYTEPYVINYNEDRNEHNGCMVYYHFGYNDWQTITETEFKLICSYTEEVLQDKKPETIINKVTFK